MKRAIRPWHWIAPAALAALGCAYFLAEPAARAGGPIMVTGPAAISPGQPFTWDPTKMPIQYRVDSGPLSQTPSGTVVINNSTGVTRVQGMFQTWQNVTTANISYKNIGSILATGTFAGGDVKTVNDFLAVNTSCRNGLQSPIIFDADGSILAQLIGDPFVIGITSICDVDQTTGHFVAAEVLLNGEFQDGIDNPSTNNFELTTNQFNQAFTHEFGHVSGLDHSQINEDVLNGQPLQCNLDEDAGLPLMFPVLFCQDRVTSGLPPLAPDDMAWISRIYPVASPPPSGKTVTSSAYGVISGTVFFSDGITPVQGVNLIARQVDNPSTTQNESLRNAVSVVSGYLFTGNFGQNVTCLTPDPTNPDCNNGGSPFGSRDVSLIGRYDIPVPPGTYTVEAESILDGFVGGSSVGPLDPPIPNPGSNQKSSSFTVAAGQTVTLNLTLQGTPGRFDSFESAQLRVIEPPVWDRKRIPELARKSG